MPRATTVYLCGGINGLSDVECTDWRAEASASLWRAGFDVLDPMRRDYRGMEAGNADVIVNSDRFDIRSSQIVLVNVARPSWGTAMELVYARNDIHQKRVVAFNAPPNPSPWLVFHCDVMLPSLSDALKYITETASVG